MGDGAHPGFTWTVGRLALVVLAGVAVVLAILSFDLPETSMAVATIILVAVTWYYARQTRKLVDSSARATRAAETSAGAAEAAVAEMRQQVVEARRAYQTSLLALVSDRMARYNDLLVQARVGGGGGWPDRRTIDPFCSDVDAIAFLVEGGFLPLEWVVALHGNDLWTVWTHEEFQKDMGREGRRQRFARLVRLCEACSQEQLTE